MGTAVAWRRTGLVLVGVLALAGCGAFGPVPSVDEFRSNVSTVPGAQEIYFTVSGSTQGPNFSAFQDYTGTLAITGDGVVAATQDIESEFFFVGVPVTFNEPGTVETFATVTASDGSTAFKMVEIQVTAEVENRGSVSNPVRLSFGGPAKATKVGTGGARNSYYRFIPGVSSATIEITDQTIVQDLDVFVYRESNFTGEQGRNEEVGTPDFTLNGLTVNDPYYIRVYNFTDASSSEFKIRVY